MRYLKYLALLSTFALLTPLGALARDKNERTVTIPNAVTIGSTQLKPGDYKVEWQPAAHGVNVTFQQYGKTVATAPAKLQTNDQQVTQDAVVMDKLNAKTEALREIDFAHQKEALVFTHSGV